MRRILLLMAMLITSIALQAQTHSPHEETVPHWRAALVMGHTVIPAGHSTERAIIPSWGIDLEYWFNEQWGIGLHNDLEIETFLVESAEGEAVERTYPLVFTLDGLWRPWKGWVLQVGAGVELEESKNYKLIRWGVEYEFEIGHHWDLSPTFFYDYRDQAYDTWSIGLGLGRRF